MWSCCVLRASRDIKIDTNHMHMVIELQPLAVTAGYSHCLGGPVLVLPGKDGWCL